MIRGRVKWTATVQIRTPLSCLCPAGQTDTGQTFSEKSRQNPDTGQNRDRQNPDRQTTDRKSGQNPDTRQTPDSSVRKIETEFGHQTDS